MAGSCRLLRYAAPYRRGWGLIGAASLAGSALAWVQPWPMQFLIDHALGERPVHPILSALLSWLPGAASCSGLVVWAALAGLIALLLGAAIDVIVSREWLKVGQRMVYDLARDLLARLHRQSLRYHTHHSVGDSMNRVVSDSWCVNNLVDTLLLTPARALLSSIGMIAIMLTIHPMLTLVTVILAPVMAISAVYFGRRVHRTAQSRRQVEGTLRSHVQRALTGIHVVQTFGQEHREHGRFQDIVSNTIRLQFRTIWLKNLAGLGRGLVSAIGSGTVMLIGAWQILGGSLTVGTLLVFLYYLNVLHAQAKALTDAYISWQELRAQAERVLSLLEQEPEVRDLPGAASIDRARGAVCMESVTFGYESDRPVLRGVSLAASPGQTVAIVGPTGAGKSTLVSLIPRFFDPWSGRVMLDGRDVREVQIHSLRRQISIVLQEPFLFPLTIAENIACGRPGATRDEIEAAAVAANAHEFIMRLPDAYETVVGERGGTLSGGERQRLAIARALLKDAPVLILDEPTSALDAETEASLVEALHRLMEGRTTFIIAHRLSTIRRADRIVVVESGKVVEAGTHDELIRREERYAQLSALQFGGAHELS